MKTFGKEHPALVVKGGFLDGEVMTPDEINKLEGPGRGVTVVKTGDDERVIGFVAGDKATTMVIENAAGKAWTLACDPREVTARGGKGHQLQKKTTFTRPPVPVTIPSLGGTEGK